MSKKVRYSHLATVFALSASVVALAPGGNQQNNKSTHSDISRGKSVDAGFTTGGKSYHSDYFDFTYSLPDGFVEGTEQYRQGVLKLPNVHPNADTFILFHCDKRPTPSADPTAGITVMADRLSRYPKGATEKDYLHHFVTQSLKDNGDDLLQEGEEIDVSGKQFFRADYKINGHPMSGYQTVILTFQRGFALSWTFIARSKADVDSMLTSMDRTIVAK
jgi:hypothetical protein